jgi:hypothetical protein
MEAGNSRIPKRRQGVQTKSTLGQMHCCPSEKRDELCGSCEAPSQFVSVVMYMWLIGHVHELPELREW